ncbi:uncharacterized protein LOC134239888 [Saccostrea cucullata]|uniref:uncharacterized protein LOC134239888 n=1 Tax=Saccostrea cuccullata TaxID=36930 RepID=UPI002ED66439
MTDVQQNSPILFATRYSRRKRQSPPYNYTLELLIVVDPGVVDWFKLQSQAGTPEEIKEEAYNKTKLHYYRVFDGIKKRFIISQELGINLELVDITLAENLSFPSPVSLTPDPRSLIPAPAILDAFRDWINTTKLPDHNHALLFTGYNLTYGGSTTSKGLSYPDSVCTELAMSVVEEFYDERSAIYAAQELGRSLGSRLDMDGNFCRSTNLNIMSTKFVFNSSKIPNLWKFSRCSKTYIKDFLQKLDSDGSNCLRSTSDEVIPAKVLPTPDADKQCKTAFGSDSFLCRAVIGTDYRTLCGGMPCFLPKSITCSSILPLDGTLCGNYSVCQEGECRVSSNGQNVQDQCPFGDQPVLPDSVGCSDRVYGRPFDCYLPSFNAACCQSCEEIKTDIKDCEYGDRLERCQYPKCPTYNKFTRENLCCLTCKNGKSPYSASTDAPLSTTSSDSVFYITSDEMTSTENGTSLISTTTPKPTTTPESTSVTQLSTKTETQTTESTALTDLTTTLMISTAALTSPTASSTSSAPLSTRTESKTTETWSSTEADKTESSVRVSSSSTFVTKEFTTTSSIQTERTKSSDETLPTSTPSPPRTPTTNVIPTTPSTRTTGSVATVGSTTARSTLSTALPITSSTTHSKSTGFPTFSDVTTSTKTRTTAQTTFIPTTTSSQITTTPSSGSSEDSDSSDSDSSEKKRKKEWKKKLKEMEKERKKNEKSMEALRKKNEKRMKALMKKYEKLMMQLKRFFRLPSFKRFKFFQ